MAAGVSKGQRRVARRSTESSKTARAVAAVGTHQSGLPRPYCMALESKHQSTGIGMSMAARGGARSAARASVAIAVGSGAVPKNSRPNGARSAARMNG